MGKWCALCRHPAERACKQTSGIWWLFSVPQDVLETHLAGEPGTPQEEVGAVHEGDRVLVPKRVALQVRWLGSWLVGRVEGEGS